MRQVHISGVQERKSESIKKKETICVINIKANDCVFSESLCSVSSW